MKMNKKGEIMRNLLKILLFSMFFSLNLSAEGLKTPDSLIEQTVEKIVQINEEIPGKENSALRRTKMMSVIEHRFNFEEMSKRSLGAHWKAISEAEQSEFVGVFSELLAKTYLDKLDQLRSGMVNIADTKIREPKALVKTMVKFDDTKFPLDYKMVKQSGDWKVYDVVIENIGLVSNYRSEFAGIIRKDQFAGLMEKLRKKVTTNH